MTQPAFQTMSVEEYLRTEPDSPVKREYVNGFVYAVDNSAGIRAQAGSSKSHARIISRLMRAIEPQAEAEGCRAYASEIKLRVEAQKSFYYPDVMVVCGPDTSDPYSETAPCLLVEVLSRGTAHTDRHAKYAVYTSIPSLQTYLIVDQYERRVYAYQREGTSWQLTDYASQGIIPLPCLNLTLSLNDIYAGVL